MNQPHPVGSQIHVIRRKKARPFPKQVMVLKEDLVLLLLQLHRYDKLNQFHLHRLLLKLQVPPPVHQMHSKVHFLANQT